MQETNYNNKSLQLISFDIEKAFDRVSHCSIIQALRAFEVPEITIMAIKFFSLIGFAYVEVNGKKEFLLQSEPAQDKETQSLASSSYWPQNHWIEPWLKTTDN